MSKKQGKIQKMTKHPSKELYKYNFFCFLSCTLVLCLTFLIFKTDFLKPKLNEMTASYISFNNSNTTDMLKISNLEKSSDKVGKSNVNKKYLDFNISGMKGTTYDIVVYPINKENDLKNIKFYLAKNDIELFVDTLYNKQVSKDGGIIIYQGKITNKNKITIRMWLTRKYHQNTHNLSFEVKIKQR